MLSQLECGQRRFMKFEMKKGRGNEENKVKHSFERWKRG